VPKLGTRIFGGRGGILSFEIVEFHFSSEVLTLGVKNSLGTGWVLIEPKNENVSLLVWAES
jgi:hypothetical protein